MKKLTLKIDGMMCPMCESHVNDAIRNAIKVKKVTSSHKKGETVVIAEEPREEEICKAVSECGYKILSCTCEEYEKRGLFSKRR